MDNFLFFVAFDADNCGQKVGQAILANQLDQLHEISDRINLGNELVKKWAMNHAGKMISFGGDQGIFEVPHEALEEIEQIRSDYEFVTKMTISVGIGKTLSEAGRSLLAAKLRGKNLTVFYDPTVEDELKNAERHLEEGTATAEEHKQGDAYLRPQGHDDMKNEKVNKAEELDPAEGQDLMYNSEQEPSTTEAAPEEHNCAYCKELEAQNIHDEECPYCAIPVRHDPNSDDHTADCQYCAVMNHDPMAEDHGDDCQYCQEMAMHDPMADGHSDDCPYCVRSHNPEEEGHPSDCKYCDRSVEISGGDNQAVEPSNPPDTILPTTQDSQNYLGQDLARPSMDKPSAISSQPSRAATITDSKTNQNIILEDTQGGPAEQEYRDLTAGSAVAGTTSSPENSDSMENIRNEIDAIGTDETPLREEGETDDANLPGGDNMENNVSRPESYQQDTPTDLGMGEQPDNEVPDMSSILQEGLDSHADNIKREKVIEMVGKALEGFKASKMIIERSKTEAPQLYDSSIAMLRAMIEMCKMLGLDQNDAISPSGNVEESPEIDSPVEAALEGQQDTPSHGMPNSETNDPYSEGEQESADEHPDYNNLFPAHPDSRGGSTDPKLQGR